MIHHFNHLESTRTIRTGIVALLTLAFAAACLNVVWASALNLSLVTTKSVYPVGEPISVNGNLTLNGIAVPDGLVTIQVDYPSSNLFVLRTRPTGAGPSRTSVDILDAVPVGNTGLPQGSFARGGYLGLNVTVRNNDLAPHALIVVINAFDTNAVVLGAVVMFNGTLNPNETSSIMATPLIQVPKTAALGTATVYVSVLTPQLPKNGGFALSLEKAAFFTVTNSAMSLASEETSKSTVSITSTDGAYDVSFRTPDKNAKIGYYDIYATSFYVAGGFPYFASNSLRIAVLLVGDVNGDLQVDIRDLATVAISYGTVPGMPKWNEVVDLNRDSVIDIADLAIVAKEYGKTASI